MRTLLISFVLTVVPGTAFASTDYVVPVNATVSKRFDAPASYYAAGNRGVEFAVEDGQAVVAAADGSVNFAGKVARQNFVTIQHEDGIRTTYSYLKNVVVRRGSRIKRGQLIGHTSDRFQWGARIGKHAYVDPLLLVEGDASDVHLVKDENIPALAPLAPIHTSDFVLGWLRDRSSSECSKSFQNAESLKLPSRHIAIAVGGLGSHTGGASVLLLDYKSLGYSPSDVLQFSYNGGDAHSNPYNAKDTEQDLNGVAQRLADFVQQTHSAHRGVPIDLFAHSLGGVVTRKALADLSDNAGVSSVVTISSPHAGADLADAAELVREANKEEPNGIAVNHGVNINATSVQQITTNSEFISELQNASLPEGVRVLSVATRDDTVVPSIRSWWQQATNVVVQAEGNGNPHSYVVSDRSVDTEIRLHLAGLPPTCESASSALIDHEVGLAIAEAETVLARGVIASLH